jgi:hypothetical protein
MGRETHLGRGIRLLGHARIQPTGGSVAETVVAGMIVGEYVADHCDENSLNINTKRIEKFIRREENKIIKLLNPDTHVREDFPERNDKDWLKRTLTTWSSGDADLLEITYEDLNIMKMEMPPGSRGYGVDNTVHHPDAEKRMAEIQAANPDADRFEMLATGHRSKQVTDACKQFGGFYLGSPCGLAARLGRDFIKKNGACGV